MRLFRRPSSTQRGRRRRGGASALEFALTLPGFVALIAIFIDYGWLFFNQAMIDTAVNSGCRAGAVTDPDNDDPFTVARDEIEAILTAVSVQDTTPDIDLDVRGVSPAVSLYCEVEVDYVPLFGFIPTPDELDSATYIRFEWQDEIIDFLAAGGGP